MLGFFVKLLSFYYNDAIINFDPVSVPWKGEREQRLRICKITPPPPPKKKEKNARKNNLKQEEKIILKIKNRNKRLKQCLTRITYKDFRFKRNTEKRDKFRLV